MNWSALGIEDFDDRLSVLDAYDRFFAKRLNHRAATFRVLVDKARTGANIVETGCLRDLGNWAGDGQSTAVLAWLAARMKGRLWTIDLSQEATCAAAKAVGAGATIYTGDSVALLSKFHEPIDILYLDSFDLDANDPLPSATHHLFEFVSARPNLRTGSIVCVDDTWKDGMGRLLGKGMLLHRYFESIGMKPIAEGYQSVWMLP